MNKPINAGNIFEMNQLDLCLALILGCLIATRISPNNNQNFYCKLIAGK